MLNSADFMSSNNFSSYGFTHQPGTSSAMLAAATAATAGFLDPSTAMANTLRASAQAFRNDMPRSAKRERTKFDERQLAHMENFFSTKQYPDGNDREIMARQLGLTETKVQIWFKNRRAKDRCQKHIENMLKGKDTVTDRKRHEHEHDLDDDNCLATKMKKQETPPPEPGQKECKIELQDPTTTSAADYIPIFETPWDDKNDIKSLQNYNFNFDPTTTATATTGTNNFNSTLTNEALLQQQMPMTTSHFANWMPNYNPYQFAYFPNNYYQQNHVNSTTMNQMSGYTDFYTNQYGQIPSLKDKF